MSPTDFACPSCAAPAGVFCTRHADRSCSERAQVAYTAMGRAHHHESPRPLQAAHAPTPRATRRRKKTVHRPGRSASQAGNRKWRALGAKEARGRSPLPDTEPLVLSPWSVSVTPVLGLSEERQTALYRASGLDELWPYGIPPPMRRRTRRGPTRRPEDDDEDASSPT